MQSGRVPFRILFLPDMPDHLTGDSFLEDWPEIPAVAAVNLRAEYPERPATIHHLMDTLDQGTITGLAKDDHIASPDFTRRKGNIRDQHIISIQKIGRQAVAADFAKMKHPGLKDGDNHFFADRIRGFHPFDFFTLDLPKDL